MPAHCRFSARLLPLLVPASGQLAAWMLRRSPAVSPAAENPQPRARFRGWRLRERPAVKRFRERTWCSLPILGMDSGAQATPTDLLRTRPAAAAAAVDRHRNPGPGRRVRPAAPPRVRPAPALRA